MEEAGFNTADIRVITAVFYAGDELIAARDPTRLQDAWRSRRQERRSATSIHFWPLIFETCENRARTKIDEVELDSPRRILVCRGLIPF